MPGTSAEDQIYIFYCITVSQLSTLFYLDLTKEPGRVLESANCKWRLICVPFNLLIIYMCVCINLCADGYRYSHICILVGIDRYIYIYRERYIHVCIYLYIYIHVCVYIYIHIYICICVSPVSLYLSVYGSI